MTRRDPNLWCRTLTILALAVWLGGLTFYAAVVIPVGSDVLGGHRAFGFITRSVTPWLNGIGAAVALLLLWFAWIGRRQANHRWRWLSWSVFAGSQLALFLLHPWLDALLEPSLGQVTDAEAFYSRHRVYLLVSTLQWAAGVVQLRLLLGLWSDRAQNSLRT